MKVTMRRLTKTGTSRLKEKKKLCKILRRIWPSFSLMTRRTSCFFRLMMVQVSWEEPQVVCRRRCKICMRIKTMSTIMLTNLTSSCSRWHLISQKPGSLLTWLDSLDFFFFLRFKISQGNQLSWQSGGTQTSQSKCSRMELPQPCCEYCEQKMTSSSGLKTSGTQVSLVLPLYGKMEGLSTGDVVYCKDCKTLWGNVIVILAYINKTYLIWL